jgi:hypothetical protein
MKMVNVKPSLTGLRYLLTDEAGTLLQLKYRLILGLGDSVASSEV